MVIFEYLKNSIYNNFIVDDRYKFLLDGLQLTLTMSIAAFVFGCLLGALFCAAKRSRFEALRKIVEVFTMILVRLPALVLLMIFVYLIFANTSLMPFYIAIITFTLKTASYLSSIFGSALDAVEKGEIEAARTLGMSRLQAFTHIAMPQAITSSLPLIKNQFIITLQDTSVVGFVALQDLTRASAIITSRTMDPYISIIISAVTYLVVGAIANRLLKLADRNKHIFSTQEA